jgi:hypothetical protein
VRLFEQDSSIRAPVYIDRAERANAPIAHSFGWSSVVASVVFLGQWDKATRSPCGRPGAWGCESQLQVPTGPATLHRSQMQFLAPRRLANGLALGMIGASRSVRETWFPYLKSMCQVFLLTNSARIQVSTDVTPDKRPRANYKFLLAHWKRIRDAFLLPTAPPPKSHRIGRLFDCRFRVRADFA